MARGNITLTDSVEAGAAITFVAANATDDHKFLNDGNTRLLVRNDGASPVNVIVTSVADPFGRTGDVTKAVAAGALVVLGPFPKSLWNQAGADVGYVYCEVATDTDMFLAAVRG